MPTAKAAKKSKKAKKRHKTERAKKKKKTMTDKITPHKLKYKTFNRGSNIRDRIEQ